MRDAAAGIIIVIAFLLGLAFAAFIDSCQRSSPATFHVLESDK